MTPLEAACTFLGYGDSTTAKVWFIGLEEAREWKELPKVHQQPFEMYSGIGGENDSGAARKTRVYPVMAKIVTWLRYNSTDGWYQHRENRLFCRNGDELLINIYPLGKAKLKDWPDAYNDLLGGQTDYYQSPVLQKRFRSIRQRREEAGKPLTICFGNSAWPDFEKCFEVPALPSNHVDELVRIYEAERLIMTPFFWSGGRKGMTDARIEKLVHVINDKKLNPWSGKQP